jgi:two-component system OmpR family response regulator
LVVDDDRHISEVVEFALSAAGHEPIAADSAEAALELFKARSPELAIVDINLPGRDGLWLCRAIRELSDMPIIFLSARDEELDRVMGLTIGGDDYVTKPFSPRELVARVGAVMRRQPADPGQGQTHTQMGQTNGQTAQAAPAAPAESISFGGLGLDLESLEAFWEGRKVDLTATEFKLLKALCQRPRKVFSREELLEQVFPGTVVSDRTIDSHILHIRKKFLKAGANEIIQTQHGLGYCLAK